ncbi:hypothetical protein P154DRAFT_361051 [Amniculicola lignicola CBS 123094]|uniref:Uncharacterized protein n=1 Tax=Amniculicola lignicola CBS 123094 TaxID=1392246 RepID=A0A6A5W468_9PLEO|nr:hypothetical protein P154DRAFT_361051 [Amniculicola lignicola CBS 123094]
MPSSRFQHIRCLVLTFYGSVLKSINGNIDFPGNALSTICSDDHLFLKQNDTPSFDGLSLNETVSHIVLVDEALRVLHVAREQYDDQWLLAQGDLVGLDLDENFIANYEHLLLRLESSLTEALSRRVIEVNAPCPNIVVDSEALLEGSHTKKQRRLLEWFTEFPNNRHPLNTTMPWSIKPSLAVLWGVCWMFYASPNSEETPRVPQNRFLNEGVGLGRLQPND